MKNQELEKRMIRHGEVLLMPVDNIPDGAVETFTGNEYIVAHSETGHHHVAVLDNLSVFTYEGRTFLRAGEDGRLEHKKSFDFHETKTIFKGMYEVIAKTAYNYFLKVKQRVQD